MVKKSGTKKTSLRELPKISDRVSFIYVEQFFPHTRGWSPNLFQRRILYHVFPAYAGVILPLLLRYSLPICFSRIRGGDPVTFRLVTDYSLFFPHTRGWSRCSQHPCHFGRFFPAEAGVILTRLTFPYWVKCFSRTRGGDSTIEDNKKETSKFFPHMRGWSWV